MKSCNLLKKHNLFDLNDGINIADLKNIVQYEVVMVAVGSKSIPEKQSISLSLSKNSEDKLEDDLFSDIFSSQSLTSVETKDSSSKINEHEPQIDDNLQTNELAKDINNYNKFLTKGWSTKVSQIIGIAL